MPKMRHWNSLDTIEVSNEKAAVYAAQGWQTVSGSWKAPATPAAVTTESTDEPLKPKKAPAKKATKKAAKKS